MEEYHWLPLTVPDQAAVDQEVFHVGNRRSNRIAAGIRNRKGLRIQIRTGTG